MIRNSSAKRLQMIRRKTNKNQCFDHLGNSYTSKKEMCKAYGINEQSYSYRINAGWSQREALTVPSRKYDRHKEKRVHYDHLGNAFETREAMCKAYSINLKSYCYRIYSGWDKKTALTTPVNESGNKSDHLGNIFYTEDDMCEAHGVGLWTYRRRIKLGWSKERALTIPDPNNTKKFDEPIDHKGNEYSTVSDMCDEYGVITRTYKARRKRGWNKEESLTTPVLQPGDYSDHLGNSFRTKKALCAAYGIPYTEYNNRIKRGWSKEEALTTPAARLAACEDHLGNKYRSVTKMCKTYNIPMYIYRNRTKNGWTKEKALTTPVEEKVWYDHLGNKYCTLKSLCEAYEISVSNYTARREHRWSVQETLTTPVKKHGNCTDHLGNAYHSVERHFI